jgi:hypothetical protein
MNYPLPVMEKVLLEKVDRLVIREAVIRWIHNWRMHLYLVKDRQSKKESIRKNLLQCLTIRWKRFWNTRLKMTNRTRPAIGVIAGSEMLTLRRLDDGVYLFHLGLYRVIHHRPIPSTSLSILVHHFCFCSMRSRGHWRKKVDFILFILSFYSSRFGGQ